MKPEIMSFVNKYVNEIKNKNAAIFIGAGFSKGAGYVDWKELLRGVAEELELDVDKETDLVSLAQYSYNKNQNRGIINDLIFEEFSKEKNITENHKILARLPIFTFWTTNYDSLIENALDEAYRIVDVKKNNEQLSLTIPHRDAIVYKMHGDKENPNKAILIKDDYEKYYRNHAQFITALSGDLISKTFLFVGFSFQDPNIDYILSRIQVDYGESNAKQHYAIMRNILEEDYGDRAEYEYVKRKQDFFISDLLRYKISTLLIDDFREITEILSLIEKKLNDKNIFISGSAHEYGNFEKDEALKLVYELSKQLIGADYNIISGFGLGIGSSVIAGALEEVYMKEHKINDNRLLLRPFPQGEDYKNLYHQYREDMISRSGLAIFLFGNKTDNGKLAKADGMMEEYQIALEKGNIIVPVGCTGYVAEEIWNEIKIDLEKYYTVVDDKLRQAYEMLSVKGEQKDIIDNILNFIKLATRI